MKVEWTPGAGSDLLELVKYTAQDRPDAARKMAERLKASPRHLGEFPEMGRMVPEFGNPELRERIVPPYRLIYSTAGSALRIVAIVHSRRLLEADE